MPAVVGPLLLVSFLLASPARGADAWPPDRGECDGLTTTMAIATCLEDRAKLWDRRLNDAYGTLLLKLRGEPERIAALRTAERDWLAFRDSDCRFYAGEEGTIREIAAVSCERDRTEARTIELEAATE